MLPDNPRNEDLAYWMGRVDTTLLALTNTVEVSLENINKVLLDHASRISRLEGTRIARKSIEFATSKADDEESRWVTWKWLVDKFLGPIVTAVLVFLIIEIFPTLFAHLGGAP